MRRWIAGLSTVAVLSSMAGTASAQALPGADDLDAPTELPDMPESEPIESSEPAPAANEPVAEGAKAADEGNGDGAPSTGADANASASTQTAEPPPADAGDPRHPSPMQNLDGTTGLQHVSAAWGGTTGTYGLALLGEFYSGRDAIRFNDVNTLFAGNLLFIASPLQALSIHARLQTRANVNTFGRPQAMLSQGDLGLGLKGSFPVAQGLWVAGQLDFDFPTDFGSAGLRFAGTSVRPRGIFSFDGSQMATGFDLQGHLNLGFQIDNSSNLVPDGVEVTRVERFAYELSAYNFFEIGLGFAYDLPYVSPFLAWNLSVPVGGDEGVCGNESLDCVADAGFGSFPNLISLGAKAEPIENLGLHAGIDFGLTSQDAYGLPVTPPWTLVFGASWTIDPRPKIEYVEKEGGEAAPPQRILVGEVVDADTKLPVGGAVIRYPSGETAQVANETGEFVSYPFTPGMIAKLVVEHPEYLPLEVDAKLETEPGEQPLTIELKPVPANAVIGGVVVNEAGEPVPRPQVRMTGEGEDYDVLANSDGTFEENVKAGRYTVAVSAPGYLTSGKDIRVEVDGKQLVEVVMKAAPAESLVQLRDTKIEIQQKVFFETGKATILPRSYDLLDQVASVMIANPQIAKIAVEGHTDDVGADEGNLQLSQARAEAVRDYLVQAGISPERLSAKGYGETRPVLPNTSDRNRSFNRRVEFNIVREPATGTE